MFISALGIAALATFFAALSVTALGDEPGPDPRELAEQAHRRAAGIAVQVKPMQLTPEQLQGVRAAADAGTARAKGELQKLAEQHPYTPAPKAAAVEAANADPAVPMQGRVVIALSSSVPETVWRELIAQVDGKREAIIVLRGFVNGAHAVAPTGFLIERVRRKNPSDKRGGYRMVDVVVDPLLYRNLGIEQVPAFAWLPDVTDISHCNGDTFDKAVTVVGNVSVGYALGEINRNGGKVPPEILKKFGG
jgi:type-F conjugative transfer system pilin assembly protein TrbC